MDIKKVVIIGSGTMGSGIAAQVANAGIPVSLLDLPSNEASRNQIAKNAKERILKSRPPLLIEKNKINLISAGNIEDDFNLIGDADWVVETVVLPEPIAIARLFLAALAPGFVPGVFAPVLDQLESGQ